MKIVKWHPKIKTTNANQMDDKQTKCNNNQMDWNSTKVLCTGFKTIEYMDQSSWCYSDITCFMNNWGFVCTCNVWSTGHTTATTALCACVQTLSAEPVAIFLKTTGNLQHLQFCNLDSSCRRIFSTNLHKFVRVASSFLRQAVYFLAQLVNKCVSDLPPPIVPFYHSWHRWTFSP